MLDTLLELKMRERSPSGLRTEQSLTHAFRVLEYTLEVALHQLPTTQTTIIILGQK